MPETAFIFPGQGAQKVGMGKEFYDSSPAAKEIFDQADNILGTNLCEVIFNGPEEKLTSTAYCQPGIFTFSVAAFRALEVHPNFERITPRFAAGLSLGEYSALVAAGVLSFEDALKLVKTRSQLMDELCQQQEGGHGRGHWI